MQTKLTLRLDSDLIEKTKKIAASRNTSLSLMVAEFFRSLQDNYQASTGIATPILQEISGIMPVKTIKNSPSEAYHEHIKEKYL